MTGKAKTVQSDGSYDIRTYGTGTFNGVAYAWADNAYTPSNFLGQQTYYDASGNAVASESFTANGGYAITLGGALSYTKTVAGDGSYDLRTYKNGTFNGVAYASVDNAYTVSNFLRQQTYFDASGNTVASQIFTASGGYSITTATSKTIFGGNSSSLLDGSIGNATVRAGSAGDILRGGPGDTLFGGVGADTFAFHSGFGHETVYKFTADGVNHDTLQVDNNVFADWTHLLGSTKQYGSDLLITLDAQDTLLLKNVAFSNFTSTDVKFV